MSEKAEDLTVNYSEAGQQLVEELDKQILSKGGWTTILFRYREWDPKKEAFGDDKYTIRRYQKRGGEYRQAVPARAHPCPPPLQTQPRPEPMVPQPILDPARCTVKAVDEPPPEDYHRPARGSDGEP